MPDAENVVAVDPVLTFVRFESPDAEPASSTYPVVAQPVAALHERLNEVPFTEADRPDGAPGGVEHTPPPTATITSFDGALDAPPLFARTRTKYEPAGTPVTVSVTAAFPVSKFARSTRPLADPAS